MTTKLKNHCPFPARAAHEPLSDEVRINGKAAKFTAWPGGELVSGRVLICKNCGAIYAEATE